MGHRFKIGDTIHYIDRSIGNYRISAVDSIPYIAYGGVRGHLPNGYYTLDDGQLVSEPLVYANSEEAGHEHAVALLHCLKDISEAREKVIAKLKEYSFGDLDIRDHENLDDLLYARKQVEHIRSIPEDKRTPAMEAVLLAVDHPSVEDP